MLSVFKPKYKDTKNVIRIGQPNHSDDYYDRNDIVGP